MQVEIKDDGRLLIIDDSAEPTPELCLSMHDSFQLQAGQGVAGDEWVKALPYERTLEVDQWAR